MPYKPGVFIWNIKADYTEGRIPIDDSFGAMGVALFKVNDGLEYQTYSPADAKQWAEGVYRPQGIDFYPWGVARGWSQDIAYQEGQLAGRHAAATGRPYVLDLEPYKEDYWQGIVGTPHSFCMGYQSTSNGQKLRLCPDARNVGINLSEWVAEPIVDIWHPQAYYTAFATHDYKVGIMSAIQPLLNAGVAKDKIYPTLPLYYAATGDPSIAPDELEEVLNWVVSQGYPGVAYWRRGVMDGKQVERLLSIDDPFSPSQPPIIKPVLISRADYDKLRGLAESSRIAASGSLGAAALVVSTLEDLDV